MKRILLALDADYLVFSCLSAAEVETEWDSDQWTLVCDHGQAAKSLKARVAFFEEEVRKRFKGGKCHIDSAFIFSDPDSSKNWRLAILPTYKFNRKKEGVRKPTGYTAFVDNVKENPQEFAGVMTITGNGDEADDVCATMATSPQDYGYDIVIPVSVDKDFKGTPSYFFHLKVDRRPHEILTISQEDADYWHLYQGMKGDMTDGFGGITGVGEQVDGTCIHKWLRDPTLFVQYEHEFKSGARKGLKELRWRTDDPREHKASLWDCIRSVGHKAGMTDEDIIIGFQMARLTRAGEPRVWQPEMTKGLLEPLI